MARMRLCTYDLPVRVPLPTLTYQIAPPAEDNPDDPRAQLLKTFSQVVMTADHRVTVSDEVFRPLAEAMRFHDDESISFVFSEEMDHGVDALGNIAFESDFAACAAKVLAQSTDEQFRLFLFPNLTRSLESFAIEP